MSTYQFLIVRLTRSTLAGGRLPSVKIRVPLEPFLLQATWSSYLLQAWVKGYQLCLISFSKTRDRPGLIYHTFLPFYYCRCPSRTTSCNDCVNCKVKDWYKWLVFGLVHQLPNDSFQRTGLMPCSGKLVWKQHKTNRVGCAYAAKRTLKSVTHMNDVFNSDFILRLLSVWEAF